MIGAIFEAIVEFIVEVVFEFIVFYFFAYIGVGILIAQIVQKSNFITVPVSSSELTALGATWLQVFKSEEKELGSK